MYYFKKKKNGTTTPAVSSAPKIVITVPFCFTPCLPQAHRPCYLTSARLSSAFFKICKMGVCGAYYFATLLLLGALEPVHFFCHVLSLLRECVHRSRIKENCPSRHVARVEGLKRLIKPRPSPSRRQKFHKF